MKKLFLNIFFLIAGILTIFIVFLSTLGYETDKLNVFFSSQISNYNKDAIIKFKKIKIKLDLKKLNIYIFTKEPNILYKKVNLPIKEIRAYISFIPAIKSNIQIENVYFNLDYIKLTDLQKTIIDIKPSNFKSIILNQLNSGRIKGLFNLDLSTNFKIKKFKFDGQVENLNGNFFSKAKIKDTNFKMSLSDNIGNLTEIKSIINEIPVQAGEISYSKENNIDIKAKIETNININEKKLKQIIKTNNFDHILKNKILVKGKFLHNLDLVFDPTLKIKEYNYDLSAKIEKSIFQFNNPYFHSVLNEKISKVNIDKVNLKYKQNSTNGQTFSIDGLYNINDTKFKKLKSKGFLKKSLSSFNLNFELDNKIDLPILNYSNQDGRIATIETEVELQKKILNINNFTYTEGKNEFYIKNLKSNRNLSPKYFDKIKIKTYKKNSINNDFEISFRKNLQIKGAKYDGKNLINIINNRGEGKTFQNINKEIKIEIDNINTAITKKINNFTLIGKIEKGKFTKLISKGEFDKNQYLDISLKENKKTKKKDLEIFSDLTEPLLTNYSFFKGIKGGKLLFNSEFDSSSSKSSIVIENFKVKNAPGFVKLLSLADLGGMADLVSGEGLTFEKLEINFNKTNNVLNLEELYAIGPSISILMDGYVESKTGLVSLRGTMVPAKNLNKFLSKIPIVGKIIIPKETGEGLFGVSFKMKGLPGKVKTSVNPIKTLTPRFITKLLEKKPK